MPHKRALTGTLTAAAAALAALSASVAVAQQPKVVGRHVIVGPARFTFLAPDLLRGEWSQQQKWLDWPTAVVQLRQPAAGLGVFAERAHDGTVRIWAKPGSIEVRYRPPARFSAENLTIVAPRHGAQPLIWHPGMKDPLNLRGTRGSLDGVRESRLPPLPPGLLSRAGFFFIDDSRTPAINPSTQWLAQRPDPEALDWYFCFYGLDYAKALRLASDLMGHVFMPPRWALGAWYSRYWPYTAEEEKDIIRTFRRLAIPLDILVIDVDWHLHGWESYDWNPKLFPDPEGFLKWVHAQGCKVTLNNHPGQLPAADSHFADFCRYIGLSPAGRQSIHINLADKRQCEAFFEVLHKPLHRQGVDFWWIDGSSAQFPGLNSQMWTTRQYFEYTERYTGKRGLLFARYGGYGSHRYPVGFSGDTYAQWGVLKYEIGYTARAGNVLYPWWSHDIGGFNGNRLPTELYVRWVQFGALSPILRLHSNHGIREPWNYGDAGIQCARRYFRLRYALIPYIYSYAHKTWQTGQPLCKALYMAWPRLDEAYRHDDEYLFGDALLVAPVADPADRSRAKLAGTPRAVTGLDTNPTDPTVALRQIWLPPGQWLDWWTGQPFDGPTTITYAAPLQRLPLFLRAGYPVVMGQVTDYVGQKPDDTLRIVFAAADNARNSFVLFEDDGDSKQYLRGGGARTMIQLAADTDAAGTTQTVTVYPTKGSFRGQLHQRRWIVEIRGTTAPRSVKVNGSPLAPVSAGQPEGYIWQPASGRLTILLARRPISQKLTVTVRTAVPAGVYRQAWAARRFAAQQFLPDALTARLPRSAATAQRIRAEAKRLASALASATDTAQVRAATACLRRLRDRDIPALARTAVAEAGRSLTAADRLKLLCSIAGVNIAATLQPTEDRRGATLRITATLAATGAESLARSILAALRTDDGQPLASAKRTLTFAKGPYPLGLIEMPVHFAGQWHGWPLEGHVSASADLSWLQAFAIVGPFDNTARRGLDRVFPPETLAAAGKPIPYGQPWKGKDDKRVRWVKTPWQFPTRPAPVFVNLERLFRPKDWTVAYATTYIWAPAPTDARLLVGSDDQCKVWLDGKLVDQYRQPRPAVPDEDSVPVRLHAGWNMLTIKVCQEGGHWGFYLHLVGRDGKPLRGLWTSADYPPPQPPRR